MPDRRRQTLGPVNVNNGSVSMGGGSLTAALPVRKNSRSRMSMAPRFSGGVGPLSEQGGTEPVAAGTPARKALTRKSRQSMGPGVSIVSTTENKRQSLAPTLMRADPRPVNDKTFINTSIKRLTNYLLTSGYDQSNLSPKSLSRPSSKDFMNIITFLVRKIDPTFNDSSLNTNNGSSASKFEDEVAHAFRQLKYPLNVSKTALAAVGSPHTWPALLAALSWLIELLECDEAAPSPNDDIAQEEMLLPQRKNEELVQHSFGLSQLDEIHKRGEKSFTQYVIRSYEAFLLGDDDHLLSCEEQLVEAFEVDNLIVSSETERLTEKNLSLVEAVERQNNPGKDLPIWEKKREDYCKDLENFEELLQKLNEHKQASEKKVNEKAAALQDLEIEMAKLDQNIKDMQVIVNTQTLSVDDVRQMQLKRIQLEQETTRAASLKQEYHKVLWETETQVKRRLHELESTVEEYNTKAASELQLIPKTALHAGGKVFYARVENKHMNNEQGALLGGVDMKCMVQPHLLQMQSKIGSRVLQAKDQLAFLLENMKTTEEDLKVMQAKIKDLEITGDLTHIAFKEQEEKHRNAFSSIISEINVIQSKISSLKDPAGTEVAIKRIREKCSELEALRREEQAEAAALKMAVANEVDTALNACRAYMVHVHERMEFCVSSLQKKQSSLSQMNQPSL